MNVGSVWPILLSILNINRIHRKYFTSNSQLLASFPPTGDYNIKSLRVLQPTELGLDFFWLEYLPKYYGATVP